MRRRLLPLVLAAVSSAGLSAQQEAGKIIALQGRVEVLNGSSAPASLNQLLQAGDLVRTHERSRAVILLVDETQLKINAATEVRLRSVNPASHLIARVSQSGSRAGPTILDVRSGEIYVRSRKTPARVEVNTPAVTAAIRGTEFNVRVAPDGESLAAVLEGSIDYRNEWGAVIVDAGEQGRARIGEAPTKTVLVNPADAVQWTLFYSTSFSARDLPFLSETIQEALLDLTAGNVQTAREKLETISDADPGYAQALGILSNVLLVQNEKEAALALAGRAVSTAPDSPAAHLSLSYVQQSFFDLEAALESARRALELDPDFVQAQVQVGRLLFGAGRTGEADRVIARAESRVPEDAQVNAVMGFILLARGRTEEARIRFEKAAALDSSLADARLGLGIVSMRRGQRTEAVAEMLAAATLEPRLSLYQSYLAKAFYEERLFEQAWAALETAVELDPRDPTPHLYGGIFQDDLNRPGEAVRSFQQSIALNDNRAVYRSRFILDQDRAVRNVSLARAYNRLGFAEWGNSEAFKSSLSDPANSSAHLFLANTFLNLDGRVQAGGSELLLARLLLPVNANSFNAFNDYTTLFERPRLFFTAEGTHGSFDAFGGTGLASGGTARFAFSSLVRVDRSDGFRPVNDDSREYTAVNFFKFALSPSSDLLLSYSNQQVRRGDPGSSFLVNRFNDPNRRFHTRTQRAEVGFHRQLQPGSDVVLLFSAREVEQVSDDPDALQRFGIDFNLRRSSRRPSISLQALHILKVSDFQIRYGFDIFEGRSRIRDLLSFTFPGDEELTAQEFNLERQKLRFKTAFIQSDYFVTPDLTLTAGLNYDWTHDDNVLDELRRSASYWNPQAGVFYTPFADTTLRLAFFRNLQTHGQERIVPPHLYGFPMTSNELDLSRSTAWNLGWDQRIAQTGFLRSFVFNRKRRTPFVSTLPTGGSGPVVLDGEFYGGRIAYNHWITERWTLVPEYSLERSRDFFALRHDHEMNLSLRFIHPTGLMARIDENFLRQTGDLGNLRTHLKVWTTQASIAWEMPEKIGLIALEVNNLFDREYEFLSDPLALNPRIPARELRLLLRWNF